MNETVSTAIGMPNLWHYRDLVRNLVAKDIKVRYMGAALGFAWSLVNPLIMTFMYLIIFTYIFRPSLPNFTLYLVTGIVHWTFFSQIIAQSPEILVANAGLIKKIYFPRLLIPLSNLLVNLVLWLIALTVFFMFIPILGGRFSLVLLAYPFYLALFIAFTWGLSLILATLYVDFRDTKHLVEVFLQVLFWSTPILYPLTLVPIRFRDLMLANPLVEFIEIFHSFFYENRLPSPHITLAFGAWTVVSVGLGLWVFNRRVPLLVERL